MYTKGLVNERSVNPRMIYVGLTGSTTYDGFVTIFFPAGLFISHVRTSGIREMTLKK